jgi:drug/metabolite transporter (DMT)-like permease
MQVRLAYLAVVLIWSTTPLAIKWSGEGLNYILGVTARMTIGCTCMLLLMLITKKRLPFHRAALKTYAAVSLQIYLGMIITYWSAQYIPSGWISVIYGLNPFLTAFIAAIFLKERSLGWRKLCAYALGFSGLLLMFNSALDLSFRAMLAVAGVFAATVIQAVSAVWIKHIDAKLTALKQITGGLLISLPLYYLSWYALDGETWPTEIPDKTLYAILYLGLIATTMGFAFYFYVLSCLPATKVAMINLITPVISLVLGYTINQEPLGIKVITGAALILLALLIYQIAERRQNALRSGN